jgi:hypothetical protein
MDFGHVERAVEMRALAGRMPGRARSELPLLDQHDVAPAFERQVIEEPDAHDTPAYDDHPRMRLHAEPPACRGQTSSPIPVSVQGPIKGSATAAMIKG